jgi:hypothetical protein
VTIQSKPVTTLKLNRMALNQRIELYYACHPRGPAAVRRPRLTKRGKSWIARMERDSTGEIVGIGHIVEEALQAFDIKYLNYIRSSAA